MRAVVLPALFFVAACADQPMDDTGGALEHNPHGDTSALSCPDFATGTVEFEVDGELRELQVELPDDPEGASVVFAWHWLNGTATQTLDWMGMRSLADDGAIVIAPESSGLPFEWDLQDASDANPDLALFDATLACLWDQHHTDTDRVYATGMSAGGLMTTFLTLHRADDLAATAPFSGGVSTQDYVQPDWQLPVLVTWGGASDTYGGFSFHDASQQLSEELEKDGHLAVRCMHDLGHLPPDEAADMASRFFSDHRRDEPSSWEQGTPTEMPTWCD